MKGFFCSTQPGYPYVTPPKTSEELTIQQSVVVTIRFFLFFFLGGGWCTPQKTYSSRKLRVFFFGTWRVLWCQEALCFGWIDSTYRPLSQSLGMQRYTPRRKIGENYSQPNMERLSWVNKKKLIHPEASFRGWVWDEADVFSPGKSC